MHALQIRANLARTFLIFASESVFFQVIKKMLHSILVQILDLKVDARARNFVYDDTGDFEEKEKKMTMAKPVTFNRFQIRLLTSAHSRENRKSI